MKTWFTPSGVRLRLRAQRSGRPNWLLIPGGPGLGSDSLFELADTMDVPGAIWMVDLPGDGSNVARGTAVDSDFDRWPGVLVEAVQTLTTTVCVGHSTGGMYLLATPEIEQHIAGLVLISTAPDSSWRERFKAMTTTCPLPAVEIAAKAYDLEKSNLRLRDLVMASAEWNFTSAGLLNGKRLLARLPYNYKATEWSARVFDDNYSLRWWPKRVGTMIVSGELDRVVDQGCWAAPGFQHENVIWKKIQAAGHFPWIENPESVRSAFAELTGRMKW